MLFIKTKVKNAVYGGKGLFANESVKGGKIIGCILDGRNFISETEYRKAQEEGEEAVIHTGFRLAGPIFAYSKPDRHAKSFRHLNEHFINHNDYPSLLYHCGLLFSTRNITLGEELTVNYHYLLSEEDGRSFVDIRTGKTISGFSGERALFHSTMELLMLIDRFFQEDQTSITALPSGRVTPVVIDSQAYAQQ